MSLYINQDLGIPVEDNNRLLKSKWFKEGKKDNYIFYNKE